MDIRLYELDYFDWKIGSDFKEINILDQHGVKVSEDEYEQVLRLLKNLPKFLGKELTKPDAIAAEVFAATNDLIPALGKIQELIVAQVINPASDMLTEPFLHELQDILQKDTSKMAYDTVMNNYKNILLKSIKYRNNPTDIQIQRVDNLLARQPQITNNPLPLT